MLPQIQMKLKDSVIIVTDYNMRMLSIKIFYLITFLFAVSFLIISCSELKDDIAAPPEIEIHGSGVFNPSSQNYHGKQVLESTNKLADCQQCHAGDFSGGTAKVSCSGSGCHPTINVHKEGIVNPASENFHSKYLKNNNKSMAECASCHGNNYSGGIASPTCANCHVTIPVHVSGIVDPSSNNFHSKYLKNTNKSMTECRQCHGEDYAGGLVTPTCANCHETINVHKEGITNPGSNNFHAKYLFNNNVSMSKCTQCHGDDYAGGLVSPTCANCHNGISVHKEGINNPSSANFHGKYISSQLGWDMRTCGSCHNSDYSGGLVSSSCLTCHTQTNGPEACNTCHGDFNDPSKIAPPRALNGSIQTTYAGVGAHTLHLYENDLGNDVRCSTCHKFPTSMYADGHLGSDGKAEILFGRLAVQGGANPQYNFTNNTCSDTYCHGNFAFSKSGSGYGFAYTADQMVGNNATVKWNQVDGSQAQCGSCHGLPPTGHIAATLNTCVNCHQGVVDANGNIIDKTKHINGVANVFGN